MQQSTVQQAATPVDHRTDPTEDCECKTNYTLQQVLLVLIQKMTGHQTHVIFTNISAELDKLYTEFNIDIKKKTATLQWDANPRYQRWYSSTNKARKKLVTYPGTDIQFYVTVKIEYFDQLSRYDGGRYIHGKYIQKKDVTENTNYIEVSVYVPQKRITFTETSMQEVLAEGDLLDMSSDIEEPELKTDSNKKKKKGGSQNE